MRVFATLAAASSLLALSSAYVHPREHYEQLFVDWMMTHNMRFENGFEFAHRLGVFADNHDLIVAHNAAGNESYSLGHNAYSHLTLDEFHQRFRLGKYRYFQSFTEGRSGQRLKSQGHVHVGELRGTSVSALASTALPERVDWVEAGAVTGVKDQGQCGSCWAFSTTGALEGAYFLSNQRLVAFSEQELVDCDKVDAGCGGGLMDNAFDWIQTKGGLPSESAYPYEGTAGRCNSSAPLVPGSKIKGHTDVDHTDAALTAAIAKQPVSVAIQADQQSFQFYSGGVLSGSCGTRLDHGVLAVGYGLDGSSQLQYYKVKNSWGPSWGEEGFIRLEKGKKQSGGQCGILLAASYPSL